MLSFQSKKYEEELDMFKKCFKIKNELHLLGTYRTIILIFLKSHRCAHEKCESDWKGYQKALGT